MLYESVFTSADIAALAFFFLSWVCYFWICNHSPLRRYTITSYMNVVRRQWMENMLNRDPKMVDALIQNGLQYGVLFFASTSLLIIGALLAGLGATEQAVDFLQELPYSTTSSRALWEIKLLLLVFIFVFAFFKFAWSYRQFNYVLIMIGAAPDRIAESDQPDATSIMLAKLHALGAQHFSTGLTSYFFALAAMGWLLNAWVFIGATIWVSLVLYRRAFASRFSRIVKDGY